MKPVERSWDEKLTAVIFIGTMLLALGYPALLFLGDLGIITSITISIILTTIVVALTFTLILAIVLALSEKHPKEYQS